MAVCAKIYVLDIPYHADRAYTYLVPPSLTASAVSGVVAEVPFGRGNRKMTGIITELTEESEDGKKPILSVIGDGKVLSEELIGLCLFMKEYTLCTFGDAVRTVVPAAAMAKVVTYYRVIPKEDMGVSRWQAALRSVGDRGRLVYALAEKKKRFSRQSVQAELEFDCTRPLLEMEAAGLCEKCVSIREQGEIRRKKRVSLSDSLHRKMEEDADAFEEAVSALRGLNQKKLLRAVRDAEGSTAEELFAGENIIPSSGKTALEALERYDLLRTAAEEDYRNPFSPEALTEEEKNQPLPVLSDEQAAARDTIVSLYESGRPCAALLHGVTGSGKTNVILAAVDRVLEDGRGVIMLVPEIALTPQTVRLFLQRYGEKIAVLHSGLSAGERYDAWRRIRDGLAPVVIGTRSAIFAPLPDIGMIIIDEEHEYTYKSDMPPKYHAHDIARYRCRDHNAVMLLSSATPSVASYYKAKTGVYTLIRLTQRYGNAALPTVELYDMRGETARGNLSPVGSLLAERLRQDKEAGNQAILFLNRRGYSNYVACRSCGKSIKCPHCSVTLTYHARRGHRMAETGENLEQERRDNGYLTCHLCGYRAAVPETCPVCGKTHFMFMGCGTQKAEDDIVSLFPDLRILRMDLDTTQAKFSHEAILSAFRQGEADVLLGTQMVTKGHDFPKVATVGVLQADAAFQADDYRAAEHTFAMLTQVIGRAGRGDIPGHAIIQTYDPDNEVLQYAMRQAYEPFYEGEIKLRKALCFPPFCDIAVLTLACADEGYLGLAVSRMMERIRAHTQEDFADIPLVLYGPFEAPVYRVQNICRMRFVLKCRLNKRTRAFLSCLLEEFGRSTPLKYSRALPSVKSNAKLTVSVDLNPSTV